MTHVMPRRGSRVGGGRITRICPICGNRNANSSEDVLPKWARRQIRAFGSYPKNQLPSILMPMCEICNRSFGRLYENDAAPILGPMISGESRCLSSADQEIIGCWIIKTTLLFYIAKA